MNENNNIFGENNNNQNDLFQPQPVEAPVMPQPVAEPVPTPVVEQPVVEEQPTQVPREGMSKIEIPEEYANRNMQNELTGTPVPAEAPVENTAGPMLLMTIFNGLAILGITYAYLNYNKMLIVGLPIFVVIMAIIFAIKDKKKSDHPQGLLIGGIVSGAIMFLLSMVKPEQSDLLMYYTIVAVATGVIGTIISSSITTLIADFKNIKALQTIGYLILFAALIAAPYIIYQKFPEEVHKYVFFEQIDVVAETEEEYILKTLKNRYGENFTNINDDENDEKEDDTLHQINQQNQRLTRYQYESETGVKINVDSIEYEPSKLQFTIVDDYLDQRYFNQLKEDLASKIKGSTGVSSVKVSLFSDKNCNFIADCVECDEYYKKKEDYDDIHKMYETSTKLNFQKDLTINSIDFVNNGKYKYVFVITSNYSGYQVSSYNDLINKVLVSLNNNKVKNTYGYEIILRNVDAVSGGYGKEVYKVKGSASDDKTFKDPQPTKEYKNN